MTNISISIYYYYYGDRMKNKFKFRSKTLNKLLLILLFIIVIYLYVVFFNNTNIRHIIINDVKYDNDIIFNTKSKSDLVYLTLNKFAMFDTYNELLEHEIIEEKNEIITEDKPPLIYIYNSHQTEDYDYRKLDHTVKPTVLYASFILKDYFNDYGLISIVETSSMRDYLTKNKLDYSSSYQASRHYINNIVKEYPSIKYFIDLHRDSVGINKTLYENDNKRYAKIMFVVGMRHNNSNKNLEFITNLNNKINEKYKGFSRGVYKRDDAKFNQDISSTAMLIELGGVDNTLEEINNSLELFSKIFVEYIGESNGI